MSCENCDYTEAERRKLIEGGIIPCFQCPTRSEEFLKRKNKDGMERIFDRKQGIYELP